MPSFRKHGEELAWRGHLVTVAVGEFEAPSGERFHREVVHHPGAVAVVPVIEEGTAVLLVRQYRAAVDGELLELPAGKRDVDGEDPAVTAGRELEEEVGMRAGRLEPLAWFHTSPGFTDEHVVVFLGLDLEPVAQNLQGLEEQHLTVERVALDDVPGLVADGAIADAKTIIGLCLARDALR